VPCPNPDPITELVATLAAYEQARLGLEATAPKAIESLGGSQAIMDRGDGRMIPGGWWVIALDDATWSALASEHQAQFRGECEK
jgi:hypothetical protein